MPIRSIPLLAQTRLGRCGPTRAICAGLAGGYHWPHGQPSNETKERNSLWLIRSFTSRSWAKTRKRSRTSTSGSRSRSSLDKIQRLGGSTMMPPDQVPNGPRIALFHDPEGHMIGMVQAKTSRS